ncbi:MAG: AsmA family protein [Deltaproteobacteria bacterium]|nr:AsmA family protein [Deltaproteobacteria bacterium]
MRKWIIAGVILICLVVVAIVGLLNVNSLIARNKDYLLGQAEAALGRKISVNDVEATLFSGLGVRLTNFAMTDDPDYSPDEFVRAKDLQVNLKFWPLFNKEVQVKRVILHDPVIRIIRGPKGSFNFSSIGQKDKEKKAPAEKEKKEPESKVVGSAALLVSLVDISGGDIRYIDRKDGTDVQLRQIDLKVEDLDLERPFSVKLAGAVFADRQNFELTSKIGPIRSKGEVGPFPLDGELNIDPLDMSRTIAAAPMLKNVLPKELDLSGVFRVKNLKFKGTLNDLAIDGEIEGTDGALRYGKTFQKAAGIPLTVALDGRYAGDRISIRKGLLKLHTLELASSGDVQLGAKPVLNLTVDSKPASLGGWEKIIPAVASYQLTGTMEVQVTARGNVGKGATPQVQGTLSLKNASAKPPKFPKPIENLDTRISFTGQKANISDMTLNLGKSRISLAASIEKFSPLTLSYKLSTPEIWPADYQSSLAEERKADVIRNLRSEGMFTMAGGDMVYQGKLSSGDGKLHNVAYKGLDTTLSLADKVANIRNLRINALSGAVQLEGEYSFKESVPRFAVSTNVKGVDVKELYVALDAKAERDIRGKLNADMKLSGNGKTWDEIKPNLKGQGEAEVLQGALLNFNMADGVLTGVTGIPGLSNIISPAVRKKYPETFEAKDTEFKELKANFDLANSRTNIKNLRMSAAEFIVQGSGWADFDRKVDFRSTINFSKPLSADLTRSTREVKYLLNNQGELAVPFALTGRMPNVKPKPDASHLGKMVQRGFMQKGAEELQNRLFGREESSAKKDKAPAESDKKKRSRTEDLIRKGLEGFFSR